MTLAPVAAYAVPAYPVLCLTFLFAAIALAACAWLVTGGVSRRALASLGIAAVVLFALTAIFDNVLIAVGIVRYDPALTSGITIGAAPLEDFSYPLAAVLLLPAVWMLFATRERKEAG